MSASSAPAAAAHAHAAGSALELLKLALDVREAGRVGLRPREGARSAARPPASMMSTLPARQAAGHRLDSLGGVMRGQKAAGGRHA